MNENKDLVRVVLLLTSGKEISINVDASEYIKFDEQAQYRTENTILLDEVTGQKVFAVSIAAYQKVKS